MARTRKAIMQAQPEKPKIPSDATLERLAKLPEDVKKMALAYAQGIASGQKIASNV